MIVRNESTVIERCLASVRDHIDVWTIVDTGSTDDTIPRMRAALTGVPGAIYERTWVDFSTNRNELLDLAKTTAEYLLLVDADMTLEVDDPTLFQSLTEPRYDLLVTGGLDYRMPYLVRSDLPWRYRGRTHEYLECEGSAPEPNPLQGIRLHHHGDGGAKADKFARDLALLTTAVRESPDDARSVFYLAQTREALGDLTGALAAYQRRLQLGGWDEELFWCLYRAGHILDAAGDAAAAADSYTLAWELRPTRAEPLMKLAAGHRTRGSYRTARMWADQGMALAYPAQDRLFVERWVYDWGMRFEWSVAAWWTGDAARARDVWEELLTRDDLPDSYGAAVRRNLALEQTARG